MFQSKQQLWSQNYMWYFSNNQWITNFNSTKIIIGSNDPEALPLITIPRFQTHNSHTILDQQQYKTLPELSKIFQYFQSQNCNRNSLINIKGGGLTLDVGGFATSVFMRGMRCNYIPTTLLSMVDASVGGKTGVNFEGKNTVGLIKQPEMVYMNVEYLKTLNRRELMNGMAEVIKMAFVYDKIFFNWLKQLDKQKLLDHENIVHIIKESVSLKIKVVEKDVNQKHQRKWLNFGHTIGHAIEYMMQPELKHGQCVSIGMVLANKLATQLGILKDRSQAIQLKQLLQKFQLPTKLPSNFNYSRCIDLMLKDKKQQNSKDVNFVLVQSIGNPSKQTTPISTDFIRKTIFNQAISVSYKQNANNKQLELNEQLFPSSKSLSIRYLYACALKVLHASKSQTIINCLSSDDTNAMIECLKKLGFELVINKNNIQIKKFEKNQEAKLNVGNSGLTARFILPLCVLLGGNYQILCDKRMQQRPNKQIFKLMEQFGANINYSKQNYCFPVKINFSQIKIPPSVNIDGQKSSQFISSILFLSLTNKMPEIKTNNTSNQLVSQSFIQMTIGVLKTFDVFIDYEQCTFIHNKTKNVDESNNHQMFQIQPDYAGLSYPYLHRLIHSQSLPRIQPQKSLQGDALFYQYLSLLQQTTTNKMSLNFNNCTDTFMTILVYVICRKNKNFQLTITNITNQRSKQSNRISAMIENLSKVSVIEQNEDGIKIRGGIEQQRIKQTKEIVFKSYDDHRIGMSMGVLSSYLSKVYPETKFIITQPHCVNKTFPNFWKWMQSQNVQTLPFPSKQLNIIKQKLPQSYYLLGMRGCGKTTYARELSSSLNLKLMQMDNICTDDINSKYKCKSISELVEKFGWDEFRQVETDVLKRITKQKNVVVATGGGIVEKEINRNILERQECIYVEKRFDDLNIQQSESRPNLSQELKTVFQRRQKHYLNLAKTIITLNKASIKDNSNFFVNQFKRKYINKQNLEGFILCLGDFEQRIAKGQYDGVEWRIDQLLQNHQMKDIRFKLAQYYSHNPLSTILTLRTQQQFGNCKTQQYPSLHKQVQKIPSQFIDAQITNIPIDQHIHNPLWSYHGSQRRWLQEMKLRQGLKKVILSPYRNYKFLQQRYLNHFDLFWTMGIENRATRLNSKIKMVTSKQGLNNFLGIMTKREFINLFNTLKKIVK